jgi:hypothetical protein
MAHWLAEILDNQAGSAGLGRRTERCKPTRVAECGKYDTLLQGGATSGRRRVPVEQAFHLRTNSVRLSGADQRAEGLRPERESTLPKT